MELVQQPDAHPLHAGPLGALIGPLFGILIADYYVIHKQQVVVDALFTMAPTGPYLYRNGYNPACGQAMVFAGIVALFAVLFDGSVHGLSILAMKTASDYSWFIGCGLAFAGYFFLATRTRLAVLTGSGGPGVVTAREASV